MPFLWLTLTFIPTIYLAGSYHCEKKVNVKFEQTDSSESLLSMSMFMVIQDFVIVRERERERERNPNIVQSVSGPVSLETFTGGCGVSSG